MWKDFFYYSKSERRAVYVLSVLIIVLAVLLIVVPEDRSLSIIESHSTDSLSVQKLTADMYSSKVGTDKHEVQKEKELAHLKTFDPNTADSIELQRLGLSSYVVRNVLKYRQKGGRFTTKESFSRIYGLSEEQYQILKPYIHISAPFSQKQVYKDTSMVRTLARKDTVKSFKYPIGTLVNIATADTTELKKIPGIGSGIAKAIVAYRNRLGGFYDLNQLKEVDYVTPELMKWFKLDELSIVKLDINQVGLEKLRAHPYINFYQAKVIIEHRRKRGKIKSLSQLSLYEEFTEKDLKRLAVYFSFD